MGWLLGLAGKYSEIELEKVKSLLLNPLHFFHSDKIYLAAGGIPETSLCSISEDNSAGWMINGLGIKYLNGEASLMNKGDWDGELTKHNFSQYSLNGHFAAVRWDKNNLELYTDQLGIRNIYLTKINDCIAFSTRIDWLSKLNEKITFNWEETGAYWLLQNQVTQKSILQNVERLNQGGKAIINFNPLYFKISNQPWHPDFLQQSDSENFISILKDFTLCGLKSEKKLSLALSGGLDSRILLSFLASSNSADWCLHSFNTSEHPDTKIARKISERLNTGHFLWEPIIPPVKESVIEMNEYIGETMLTSPASKFLNLRFYPDLYNQNKIVIDGGYGEIARKRYLVNFLFKGREAIYNKDSTSVISLMKHKRADIFNDEFIRLMHSGLKNQLDEMFQTMPDAKIFGIGNWMDLFMIRTRVVYFSAEQSRSDSKLVNYMPFIQPSFLKKIFETPVEKRGSKIFYREIKKSFPLLSEVPLVKGGMTYPFGLNNISASVVFKIKKKFGFSYKEKLTINFLETLSEYFQDIVNSKDVVHCEYYDYKKVMQLVNGFYRKKNFALADELDWWLTFETWRRIVENK